MDPERPVRARVSPGIPEGTVNQTFADSTLRSCAEQQGVDYDAITTCSEDADKGVEYFAAEAALTPAHTGVPFITLDDGEPVYNDGTLDLVATICEAYKGIVKPSACTEHLKRKAYGAGAC